MSILQNLSSRQHTAAAVFIGLVACLVLMLLAETAVRIRAYVKYGYIWGIEKTFTIDQKSGLRVPIAGGKFGSIQINSLGFRSPELEATKPPGTIRIAFLGGSTTYCAEVSSPDLTWPHLVATELSRRFPHAKIDYVNGGVPGYGADTSLRNLEERIIPLEPDVIVIYHATNDLSSNSYQLAINQGIVAQRTEKDLTWLSEHSLLAYLVEKNLKILYAKNAAESQVGKLKFNPDMLAAPFKTTLMELTAASGEAADLVVLITFSHHLRPGQTDAQKARAAESSLFYMPYMSINGLLEAFEAYNVAIREVAHETGTLMIESEPHIPGDPEYFVDSVHLSDIGSQTMASIVAKALANSPEFQNLAR